MTLPSSRALSLNGVLLHGAVRAMCRTARRITLRTAEGETFALSWAACVELFTADESRPMRFPDTVDLYGIELDTPSTDEPSEEGRFLAHIRSYDAVSGRLTAVRRMGSG